MSNEKWRESIPYDRRRYSRTGCLARALLVLGLTVGGINLYRNRDNVSQTVASTIAAIRATDIPTPTGTPTLTPSSTPTSAPTETPQPTVKPIEIPTERLPEEQQQRPVEGLSPKEIFSFTSSIAITLMDDTQSESRNPNKFHTLQYYGDSSYVVVDRESIFTGGGEFNAIKFAGNAYRVDEDGSVIGPIRGVFIAGNKRLMQLNATEKVGGLDISNAHLPQVIHERKTSPILPLIIDHLYGRLQIAYLTREGQLRVDEEYYVSNNQNFFSVTDMVSSDLMAYIPRCTHDLIEGMGLYSVNNNGVLIPVSENGGNKIFRVQDVASSYATKEPDRYPTETDGWGDQFPRSSDDWPGIIIYEGMDIPVIQ